MLNVIEGQIKFKGMIFRVAELPPVVGQNGANSEAMFFVKRQHIVVNKGGSAFGLLTGMQKAKSIRTICVDTGVEIDGILALQNSEDTTVPALKRQLADTERGIENIQNAIQQGVLTSSTKERLEALEKQKEDLKIAILQVELQKPKYTKEQIVSWIGQFKYGDVNRR